MTSVARKSPLSEAARAGSGPLGLLLLCLLTGGCAAGTGVPSFSLKLEREASSPPRAMVTIDEQYVGTLGYVAARGVRLPIGEHRLSVEHTGYFPYDTLIRTESTDPMKLVVKLTRIPD